MTNREMMEIAMRQSAEDMGCHVEDFKADKNVVVPINLGKKARKYLKEPITCNLVSYGNNIMAASFDADQGRHFVRWGCMDGYVNSGNGCAEYKFSFFVDENFLC